MISRRLLILFALLVSLVLGLGIYALHLARRARVLAPVAADNLPVTPPVSGPTTQIELFVASDEDGMLHRQETAVALPIDPAKRAREILRTLVLQYQDPASTHPLGTGADINDVYLVNGNLIVVDANAVLANTHPSGILVEELTLALMAQTLAANVPGTARMKLLVDGKERTTLAGHADLSEPYDVNSAMSLVKP